MDAEQCLVELDRAIQIGDRETVAERADALIGWLEKDGFMPGRVGSDWRRGLSRKQYLSYLRDLRQFAEAC
jgi:hypothetical protein